MSSLEKSAWNLIAVVRTYRISQFFVEFSISRKKIFFPGEEEFKFQEDEHCLQEPKSIGQRDRDLTEVDNRV